MKDFENKQGYNDKFSFELKEFVKEYESLVHKSKEEIILLFSDFEYIEKFHNITNNVFENIDKTKLHTNFIKHELWWLIWLTNFFIKDKEFFLKYVNKVNDNNNNVLYEWLIPKVNNILFSLKNKEFSEYSYSELFQLILKNNNLKVNNLDKNINDFFEKTINKSYIYFPLTLLINNIIDFYKSEINIYLSENNHVIIENDIDDKKILSDENLIKIWTESIESWHWWTWEWILITKSMLKNLWINLSINYTRKNGKTFFQVILYKI